MVFKSFMASGVGILGKGISYVATAAFVQPKKVAIRLV